MDQKIVDIYDEFTNGYLNRRVFLKKLAFFTGGTPAAYAILSQLENNAAMAEVVAKDDPRLLAYFERISGYCSRRVITAGGNA